MSLCYENVSLKLFSYHWSFKYKDITVYYIYYAFFRILNLNHLNYNYGLTHIIPLATYYVLYDSMVSKRKFKLRFSYHWPFKYKNITVY